MQVERTSRQSPSQPLVRGSLAYACCQSGKGSLRRMLSFLIASWVQIRWSHWQEASFIQAAIITLPKTVFPLQEGNFPQGCHNRISSKPEHGRTLSTVSRLTPWCQGTSHPPASLLIFFNTRKLFESIRDICHVLVHSPNCRILGLAQIKARVQSFIWVSHEGDRGPNT